MLFISYLSQFYACGQNHLFLREKVAVLSLNVQNVYIHILHCSIYECQIFRRAKTRECVCYRLVTIIILNFIPEENETKLFFDKEVEEEEMMMMTRLPDNSKTMKKIGGANGDGTELHINDICETFRAYFV